MRAARSARTRHAAVAWLATAALFVSVLVAGPAPAATLCANPPPILPTSQVVAGMTGTGYTTIQGTSPTQFSVEILGVIPDYIWLDLDVVVARITGPQSLLDQIGGAFFGMSGSPVYVGGKLVGAVSYGVSWDPTLVGLTPGQALVDILGASGGASAWLPQRIPFDDATRRSVARALGMAPSQVTGGLEVLPSYLGVSGLSGAKLQEFQAKLDERGEGFRAVPSGSMDANLPISPIPFSAGQPVGSVLSWGDFTIWAAGTVAVACGDEVVAYGHSLFWYPPGDISIGMTGVKVLTVGGGGGIFPGNMVPVLTEPRGAFVQDRFAGQAGVVGMDVPSTPITSSVSSPDTGLSRTGTTESVYQESWWLPWMVWGHMVLNFGVVAQRLGDGTSELSWTIDGTRQDGTPFTVANRAMLWSPLDATEIAWRLAGVIEVLKFNGFEEVEITGVDAAGSITEQRLQGRITNVRTSSSLQPALRSRDVVKAVPGERITVEVTLTPIEGGADSTAVLSVKVPRGAEGSFAVKVRGGRDRGYSNEIASFYDLLALLSGGEHENDLIVSALGSTQTAVQPMIVDGKTSFRVQVVRR